MSLSRHLRPIYQNLGKFLWSGCVKLIKEYIKFGGDISFRVFGHRKTSGRRGVSPPNEGAVWNMKTFADALNVLSTGHVKTHPPLFNMAYLSSGQLEVRLELAFIFQYSLSIRYSWAVFYYSARMTLKLIHSYLITHRKGKIWILMTSGELNVDLCGTNWNSLKSARWGLSRALPHLFTFLGGWEGGEGIFHQHTHQAVGDGEAHRSEVYIIRVMSLGYQLKKW